MFGSLRTTLAIIVMVGHLLNKWQIGSYAVFGFYMVSGYLMTCIMQQSYGFSWRGRGRFVVNRFLRLYPLYWIAAALSLALIAWLGSDYTRDYHPGIFIPLSAQDILANSSMVYPQWFANEYTPILVPTTWAITVELFFYAAICLGLSKTRRRVIVWLLLSLLYVLYCLYYDLGWRYRYFPIFAGSLPFAMGAFIYFLKQQNLPSLDDMIFHPWFLLLGTLANMLLVVVYPYYFEMGFYINALFSVLLCYQLAVGVRWGGFFDRFDKPLGEFSYPIYLLHWQAGIFSSYLLYAEPVHHFSPQGVRSLLLALLLVLALSWALLRVVDRPVQQLRQRFKPSH